MTQHGTLGMTQHGTLGMTQHGTLGSYGYGNCQKEEGWGGGQGDGVREGNEERESYTVNIEKIIEGYYSSVVRRKLSAGLYGAQYQSLIEDWERLCDHILLHWSLTPTAMSCIITLLRESLRVFSMDRDCLTAAKQAQLMSDVDHSQSSYLKYEAKRIADEAAAEEDTRILQASLDNAKFIARVNMQKVQTEITLNTHKHEKQKVKVVC
eukprot:GHVQ01012598.1.p1 GENE.GHVQ01012598.1~~GHVQ01012598.1.p1  ORF type:complete len:209 (-),score=32.98 GHVQ01012598.1:100-726(-)